MMPNQSSPAQLTATVVVRVIIVFYCCPERLSSWATHRVRRISASTVSRKGHIVSRTKAVRREKLPGANWPRVLVSVEASAKRATAW